MVENYLTGSKLVVLTTSPSCIASLYVINEDAGHWDNDIWFSNRSCTPRSYAYWSDKSSKAYSYKSADYDSGFGKEWVPLKSTYDSYIKEYDYTDAEPNKLYEAELIALATNDELYDMTVDCVNQGVKCVVCTGITECYCEDTCHECFEMYHYCDCFGPFISLTDKHEDTSIKEDYKQLVAVAADEQGWPWSE